MTDRVRELSDADFADAVKGGVALVDFCGTWCPPCKLLDPVMEALAEKYAGRALVARLNVDDNFEAAADNGIEDIPTLVFFKDGAERSRLFGAQRMDVLEAELDKILA